MGLEGVIERINRESEEEERRLFLEAETEAEKILNDARAASREKAVRAINNAKSQAETLLRQEDSSAELEAKKMRLSAQREMLDKIRAECLAALPGMDHTKILPRLISRAKTEMPGAVYIYSCRRDEQFVRTSSGLAYAANIECAGGIIVEDKDRSVRLDLTYETIASEVWDDSLKEIAHALFGTHDRGGS